MTEMRIRGRVPHYTDYNEEIQPQDTREVALQISDPDGVLIVDLALSGEENAILKEDSPRLWIHWEKGRGWTIDIHKDEGPPFVHVQIHEDVTTTTRIVRGFDNKIVDARKIDEP